MCCHPVPIPHLMQRHLRQEQQQRLQHGSSQAGKTPLCNIFCAVLSTLRWMYLLVYILAAVRAQNSVDLTHGWETLLLCQKENTGMWKWTAASSINQSQQGTQGKQLPLTHQPSSPIPPSRQCMPVRLPPHPPAQWAPPPLEAARLRMRPLLLLLLGLGWGSAGTTTAMPLIRGQPAFQTGSRAASPSMSCWSCGEDPCLR
mmetsp:Transcript_27884/g.71697  ORF Transcript_27884/g.71697 Transcript_27884/m.71697 type:complete len:201 (-) Transcript_27884:389-991(-)